MKFLPALRALFLVIGAAALVRAIARRTRRSSGRALDPAVSLGLRVGAGALAALLVGVLLAPLRLVLGWPRWVGQVGDGLLLASMVVLLPLAAWLGWRLFDEEVGTPRSQRPATGGGQSAPGA